MRTGGSVASRPVDDDGRDWFGNPIGADDRAPRAGVPCPACGELFAEADGLRAHIAGAHDARALPGAGHRRRTRSGRSPLDPSPWRRFVDGLRFVPLWFVLPLNVLFVWLVWLSVSDPLWNPVGAMVVRLSLLPLILLLAARVAGRKPR